MQTALFTIDVMNSMDCGQRISLFSATGLPHIEAAAQLVVKLVYSLRTRQMRTAIAARISQSPSLLWV